MFSITKCLSAILCQYLANSCQNDELEYKEKKEIHSYLEKIFCYIKQCTQGVRGGFDKVTILSSYLSGSPTQLSRLPALLVIYTGSRSTPKSSLCFDSHFWFWGPEQCLWYAGPRVRMPLAWICDWNSKECRAKKISESNNWENAK